MPQTATFLADLQSVEGKSRIPPFSTCLPRLLVTPPRVENKKGSQDLSVSLLTVQAKWLPAGSCLSPGAVPACSLRNLSGLWFLSQKGASASDLVPVPLPPAPPHPSQLVPRRPELSCRGGVTYTGLVFALLAAHHLFGLLVSRSQRGTAGMKHGV